MTLDRSSPVALGSVRTKAERDHGYTRLADGAKHTEGVVTIGAPKDPD